MNMYIYKLLLHNTIEMLMLLKFKGLSHTRKNDCTENYRNMFGNILG